MNNHSTSFSPTLTNNLFSDRFNQIDKIFSTLTGIKPLSNIPNYDLFKYNNNTYQLILTVPGFQEHELDISIEHKQLIITGKQNIKNKNQHPKIEYIYQGIKNQNFSITFNLNNKIKINKAILNHGLLKINFEYEIPEHKKIQKINIEKE